MAKRVRLERAGGSQSSFLKNWMITLWFSDMMYPQTYHWRIICENEMLGSISIFFLYSIYVRFLVGVK